MRLTGGWVDSARQSCSPNCDERPGGVFPEVLIIHSISLPPGKYGGGGVEQLFNNTLNTKDDPYYQRILDLRVSCHFFIRRDGELIQFVSTEKRAWHCGQSTYLGRQAVNDFSLGVELEGLDYSLFEAQQYRTLIALTRCIQAVYPQITAEHILGHQHISPGRKTDPGSGFDWYYYLSTL